MSGFLFNKEKREIKFFFQSFKLKGDNAMPYGVEESGLLLASRTDKNQL